MLEWDKGNMLIAVPGVRRKDVLYRWMRYVDSRFKNQTKMGLDTFEGSLDVYDLLLLCSF